MFVYTLKLTTLKYIGVMTLCAAAMITTVALVPAADRTDSIEAVASADYKKVKEQEDRIKLLKGLGWEVDVNSETQRDVIIPEEFDETYKNYNALQKSDGFNLEKYKGKKVKLYTYTVTNHKDGKALATIIVYKNRIIAGDVSLAVADGEQISLTDTQSQT